MMQKFIFLVLKLFVKIEILLLAIVSISRKIYLMLVVGVGQLFISKRALKTVILSGFIKIYQTQLQLQLKIKCRSC